jgi:hypothetical protein
VPSYLPRPCLSLFWKQNCREARWLAYLGSHSQLLEKLLQPEGNSSLSNLLTPVGQRREDALIGSPYEKHKSVGRLCQKSERGHLENSHERYTMKSLQFTCANVSVSFGDSKWWRLSLNSDSTRLTNS